VASYTVCHGVATSQIEKEGFAMTAWLSRIAWCVLLGAALPGPLHAQARPAVFPEEPKEGILWERDLARARFEASQASVKDLARRRLEVARNAYQERLQEFREGRGTLDILLRLQVKLTRAQKPLVKPATVNRQALEEHWRFAFEVYKLNRLKYEASRATAADYYESLYIRLDAEIQLALTRPKKK
jgi:hypothetical protein